MQTCRVSCRELLTFFACLVSLECQAQAPPAIDWNAMPDEKLSITARAQPPGGAPTSIQAKVLFSRHYAVALSFDPDARYDDNWKNPVVFDLAQMTWYHENAKQWVPLAKCREWEQASIERSRATLARETDPNLRAFVEATMNPQLRQRRLPDGGLELSNSHLTYVVTPTTNAAPYQLERFVRYDQINAYHKAMTSTRTPPTAQIAVDNALFQNRLFPKQMTTSIKTGKGNLTFTTDSQIEAFTPSDANEIRSALAVITP